MAAEDWINDYDEEFERQFPEPTRARHGNPWSPAEERGVIKLLREGRSPEQIASRLDRSTVAIQLRIIQMYDIETKLPVAIKHFKGKRK